MKLWSHNRALDALYKTLVILVVVHVLAIAISYIFTAPPALWGIRMVWPHLQIGWWPAIVSVAAAVLIWWLIWAITTPNQIEKHK